MHWELSAAKVVPEWSRRIKDKAAVDDELPTFFERSLSAHKFEVVDVDAQNELEPSVEEEALPTLNGLKTTFQQFFCEVVFPVFATHWVAV